MKEIFEEIIVDEIRNHGLNTSALIQFLDLKGIINADEFFQYLDEFAKSYIKRRYPDLPVE